MHIIQRDAGPAGQRRHRNFRLSALIGFALCALWPQLSPAAAKDPRNLYVDFDMPSMTVAPPAPAVVTPTMADVLARLQMPLSRITISSPYGVRRNPVLKVRMFHAGVDLAAPDGTPVHAAQDGTVEVMEGVGHFGFCVRLRHDHGVETEYAHMLHFMPGLHRGSVIRRGDVIGFVGATGRATGAHLHYEVLVNGAPVDPMRTALPAGGYAHLVSMR